MIHRDNKLESDSEIEIEIEWWEEYSAINARANLEKWNQTNETVRRNVVVKIENYGEKNDS